MDKKDVKDVNYVTTPTAEGIFAGSNDLVDIPAGVIVSKAPELNVKRAFARTKEITEEDIGYTPFNGSPFSNENGATYDIQDSMKNRTTITKGDGEIFDGIRVINKSAVDVIPRATKTTPGIIIVGDNLTVDEDGRISAQNSYVHPSTHPASMIEQDSTHRFVTDTEKNTWNAKANTSGTYTGLVVGSAGKWTTARTVTLSGGVSGSFSIDGSANVTCTTTLNGNYLPLTGGTINGALTVTGQILSNADVVAYSDARFKTNLKKISNPLDVLEFINGYRYEMLGVENSKQVGLIAQEVNNVLPEAVITDQNGFMGIRYTNIIPLLVEAVKELLERVKELEKNTNNM